MAALAAHTPLMNGITARLQQALVYPRSAMSVALDVTSDRVKLALSQLSGVVVVKAPCAARCTLLDHAPWLVVGDACELRLQLRCVTAAVRIFWSQFDPCSNALCQCLLLN